LIEGIFIVHQNVPFCVPTPLQEAVAIGFEKTMNEEKNYFPWLKDMYQKKRDLMCSIIKNSGLIPIVPQGELTFE
jgi:aspartate/methionine/tyrosine aminotransferase